MKRCFSCYRTQDNDALNYCPYDGTALSDSEYPQCSTLSTDSTPQPKAQTIFYRVKCPHCENTTEQTLLYTYEYLFDISYMNSDRSKLEVPAAYFLFMCSTCDELILYHVDSLYPETWPIWSAGNDWADPARYDELFKREGKLCNMYPSWRHWINNSSIPVAVRQHYLDASNNKARPNVFVSQIRSALEAICDDKGIGRGKLSHRLRTLAAQEKLPAVIISIAHELRELGNIGAHSGNHKVEPDVVGWVSELFRSLIEYLYVTPGNLKKFRTSLKP